MRIDLVRPFKAAFLPFLDFLYPPECLGCGAVIHAHDVLCGCCLADLPAFPFDDATSRTHLDSMTFRVPASLMYIGYEFEPEGAIGSCIHTMKYRGLHRIAGWLGRLLGERCAGTGMLSGDPVLAPIPLHSVKRIERGYNQAEHVCMGVARETGLEMIPDLLIRTRFTASQAASRLDIALRRDNMLNAFAVNPKRLEQLKHRPVILVDDVVTTGATMMECAGVLKESGVSDIRLLSVARPAKNTPGG
jgi:ComF family protein